MTMDRLGGRTFEQRELEPAAPLRQPGRDRHPQRAPVRRAGDDLGQLESQLALQHELMDLSTLLLSSLDQREVFSRITTMLKDIVDYDAMDIRMLDEATRELVCIYSRDINAEQNEQFRISIDSGLAGWVVRHDEAQLVNDMANDPRGVHIPGTGEDVPQASIVVPLRVRGKVTGVPDAGPPRRTHVRDERPRAGHALRQPGGDRHPERPYLRGDGAPGDQRRSHRHPQLPALPRVAEGGGQPRRALRRALLPPDDGPRPLQGGQRHHRPPEGRRRAARGLRRAAQLLARVRLPRPLRRRGVRHDPAAHGLDEAPRSPSASASRSRCSTRAIPTCT